MLSRTAASLYWIGRYVERAEFIARLIEATVRLDALSARPAGRIAWESALAVADVVEEYALTGDSITPQNVANYLSLSPDNPSSIRSCLDYARGNARAVRTALTRDAWEAINRAWLGLRGRSSTGNVQSTLSLVEDIRAEARGFEGALHRMLLSEAHHFIALGAAIERADNTARLIDVKYHLLLPEGEHIGGLVDRDQWTTILHTVSAVTAYRWLYQDGLSAAQVAELLILRPELPRSLAASTLEIVNQLTALSNRTGLTGEAEVTARARHAALRKRTIGAIIKIGTHEYLTQFIEGNAKLDGLIAKQFRFA